MFLFLYLFFFFFFFIYPLGILWGIIYCSFPPLLYMVCYLTTPPDIPLLTTQSSYFCFIQSGLGNELAVSNIYSYPPGTGPGQDNVDLEQHQQTGMRGTKAGPIPQLGKCPHGKWMIDCITNFLIGQPCIFQFHT